MRIKLPNGWSLASRLAAIWAGGFLSTLLIGGELYVSPRGDDSWSGRLPRPNAGMTDGPLATLQGARDAMRKQGPVSEPRKVVVEGGQYLLAEPIKFSPADSGTEEFPVVYEAEPGGRPVFSGGAPLPAWTVEADGRWSADIPPGVQAGEIEQLWIGGKRATRARIPNRGFWVVSSVAAAAWGAKVDQPLPNIPPDWRRYHLTLGRSGQTLPEVAAAELASVRLITLQAWEMTRRKLTDYSPAAGSVDFAGPELSALTRLRPGTRVYLEGASAFLDEPGEWSAANGKVYYLPRPGEQPAQAQAIIPRLDRFLVFEGGAGGRRVEHIKLRGLAFEHGQWRSPDHGINPEQAAHTVGASIEFQQSRDITLESCEIAHIGTYAIWIRAGCSEISVLGNFLHDLGGGGIRIGEEKLADEPGSRTERIVVDNNIIREGGRLFESAVGVWIGQSGKNRITHNDISDFKYTGISVGWTWGYGPSAAAGNAINYNRIHKIGGPLSDLAGIYFLGNSPGTECIGNRVERVAAAEYGGWGLYLDEGSSKITIRDNVVWDTRSGGLHQHFGRDNFVTNNVFALGRDAQLELGRSELDQSLGFERNVVIWAGGPLFAGNWEDGTIKSDYNLYLSLHFSWAEFFSRPLAKLRAKDREQHSVMTTVNLDVRKPFSWGMLPKPALARIGFQEVAATLSGVYGDREWLELAGHPKD